MVTLEVAYRLRHGEKPTLEEYRSRFPGQARSIEEAFQHPAVARAPSRLGGAADAAVDKPVAEVDRAADRLLQLDLNAEPYALATDFGASRSFGDYELREKISRDETGVVYRAHQISVDRIVALKLIMAYGSASDTVVHQFYRDMRAVAALDHPGIVPIFDVGQHEGQHFVSMGFIGGETLAKKKASGPLGLRDGVEIIAQVAEIIAYAHSKGIMHRNLTPKNILLNARARPKVSGFSSSAPPQSEGLQPVPGRVAGTASYLAPEQTREGQEIGPATDIHALGALLYFVLTGEPPFRGANLLETLLKVANRDPKPPRRLNPSVPRELQAICLKCLQKRPERRYPSAAELATHLGHWLRNEHFGVPHESSVLRSARLLKQLGLAHPRLSIATAGVLAAIVLSVATLSLLSPPAATKSPPIAVAQPRVDEPGVDDRSAAAEPERSAPTVDRGLLEKGKDATALVEVEAEGGATFGSAFCIDGSGLFVTAAHVLRPILKPKAGTVQLVLHGGERDRQKLVRARVLRSSAELDLAVLKLEASDDVPLLALELGHNAGLVETAEVRAFGYPLGPDTPHQPGQYPSVSVSVGHITALPKNERGLSMIQLDAALNPGNSGGPVLDWNGAVIGVVAVGIQGASGLNYAIPVDQLAQYLAAPEVVFDPQPIREEDLNQPVVWTIEVQPPTKGVLPSNLSITVELGRGAQRREASVKPLSDRRFRAEVVPGSYRPVDLTVSVGGETLEGRAADQEIKVGGQAYALSGLSYLQRLDSGPKYRILIASGKELIQPVEGLGKVKLDAKGHAKPLDLSSASVIKVQAQNSASIEAVVEVKAASSVLATARRDLTVLQSQHPDRKPGAKADSAVPEIPPAEYKAVAEERKAEAEERKVASEKTLRLRIEEDFRLGRLLESVNSKGALNYYRDILKLAKGLKPEPPELKKAKDRIKALQSAN
jgi:serine/threonine protein kinase